MTLSEGSLFLVQKAAMTLAQRDICNRLEKHAPWEWNMVALPYGRQLASYLKVSGYAISNQCKRPKDAWKLISFLTRETCQATMIQSGGYAPSWQSLLKSKIFLDFPGPQAVQNTACVDSLGFARLPPPLAYWKEVAAILTEEMSSLILDEHASARVAVQQMHTRMDELRWIKEGMKQKTPNPVAEKKQSKDFSIFTK